MADPQDLNLDAADEETLTAVQDALLKDENFEAVEFYDDNPDNEIEIEVIYAGDAHSYHREVFYGNHIASQAYDIMEQNGVTKPENDPEVGVLTDNDVGMVTIKNVYPLS